MAAKRKSAAGRKSRRNAAVDESLRESFPASDPPSYMGGNHIVGAPERKPTRKRTRKAKIAPKRKAAKTARRKAKKTSR